MVVNVLIMLFTAQVYSAKDIRDLKVLHSVGSFREGRNVILTLKDSGKCLS